MRPDDLYETRARSRATGVAATIVAFHVLMVALMGLMGVLIFFSVVMIFEKGRFNPRNLWKFAVFLWVAWKAVTVRAPVTPSSQLADLGEYPGLAQAIADAALRVGAEPPPAVRITAAARIYAKNEGGVLGSIFGSRRLLVVGAAALPYLTETEFKALLARSLARWGRRETWYGVQALRVQIATELMIEYLGSTWARWINPFYWLFVGFRKAFGRTLAAYLRERELWADQMAAQAYTAAEAESAIKKQALYDSFWMEELRGELTGGGVMGFHDVWGVMGEQGASFGGWQALWAERLNAGPDPGSTEPSLRQRLEALAASPAMPVPLAPALSPATAILLRD